MIEINWPTGVIFIPKNYLTLIQTTPTEVRELNINNFRLDLKTLETSEDGISFTKTHVHYPEANLGGLSIARVVRILEPYTITFEDDQYAVNLIGANSNIADKINVNQVSVRSNNSAGLITAAAIEYGEFEGAVTIDVVNGLVGTVYPKGTRRSPVNNISDALLIAQIRGFNKINIIGNYTFEGAVDIQNMIIKGEGPTYSEIVINWEINAYNCTFKNAKISGILDGDCAIENCYIGNISYINGRIYESLLLETIVLSGAANAHILNCWSGVAGGDTPIIDMGGSGKTLGLRNYNGGIKLINKTGSEPVSLDINSGQVKLDSSISNGEIHIRGIGKLTDDTTGSAVVVADNFINKQQISSSVWDTNITSYQTSGTAGNIMASIPLNIKDSLEKILGLVQHNFRMTNQTYNAKGNLTSSNIKIYENATDCNNQANEISEYLVNVIYEADGIKVNDYKVTEA